MKLFLYNVLITLKITFLYIVGISVGLFICIFKKDFSEIKDLSKIYLEALKYVWSVYIKTDDDNKNTRRKEYIVDAIFILCWLVLLVYHVTSGNHSYMDIAPTLFLVAYIIYFRLYQIEVDKLRQSYRKLCDSYREALKIRDKEIDKRDELIENLLKGIKELLSVK